MDDRASENAPPNDLPRSWIEAPDQLDHSNFARRILGPMLHQGFVGVKRTTYVKLAQQVSEAEWALYGFAA